MALSCGAAGRLSLASVGGHATEAERLELEAHLVGCARCSDAHATVGAMRTLRATEPAGLSAAARERVRRAALAGTARPPTAARRRLWPLGAGLTVAMAAIAVAMLVRRPLAGARIADARVVGGDVAIAAASAGDGAVRVRSARGGEVRLDDAVALLGDGTSLLWRRSARSVELRAGRVTFDVQHRPGQHFQVRTPRFIVQVVGTRFTVNLDGVRTERGLVRVVATDGRLLGEVGAGRSWTVPAPTPPQPPPEEPSAPPPAPPLPPALPPAARAAGAVEAPAARLARARRALAQGAAGEARRLVSPIFHLGRQVAVEARVIDAESFLIEGRYADAIDGYETVARDFPRASQAESALYAVAQLESEHGEPSVARDKLQRYLARYPHGRFAREAAVGLARLAGLTTPTR